MAQAGRSTPALTSGLKLKPVYVAAILTVLAVIMQATLITRVRFFGASANLVLALVVVWSLLRGIGESLPWAFVAGLLLDLVAGLPLGASSLALMAVCFLAAVGEGSLFQGHVFLAMIAVAIATPLYAWVILLIEQLLGMPVDWAGTTVRVVVPELLLSVVLTSLLYPVLRRLVDRLGAGRLGW